MAGVAYCTLHFFIIYIVYSTVQYSTIKLRQVVVGESYSSSLEAEQLVQAVTGPRYPSAVQCSAVQYSTVQYSTVQYSTLSTVQSSVLQVHHGLEDRGSSSLRFETCLKMMELYFVHWNGY